MTAVALYEKPRDGTVRRGDERVQSVMILGVVMARNSTPDEQPMFLIADTSGGVPIGTNVRLVPVDQIDVFVGRSD